MADNRRKVRANNLFCETPPILMIDCMPWHSADTSGHPAMHVLVNRPERTCKYAPDTCSQLYLFANLSGSQKKHKQKLAKKGLDKEKKREARIDMYRY
jgi:hypothetical protein